METLLRLTEEPPSCKIFSSKTVLHDPVLLYGFKIKDQYDQRRVKFKSKFSPINIKTLCSENNPHYFTGIQLIPIQAALNKMLRLIKNMPYDSPNIADIYKQRLKLCSLTCNDNWSQLKPNIFPLDTTCVRNISTSYNISKLSHEQLLETEQSGMPWHSHYVNFNIYILT